MKILLLCSGGDGPGMNRFIYNLYESFKDSIYFAHSGFRGLIDNQIFPLSKVARKELRDMAGSMIGSSRCPEFKERKYFKIALENARKFDCIVILGGNGSERGAKELFDNGVNTLFVPGTIDNDVNGSDYSIGFSTAVNEGVYTINHSMPSIQTMEKACLFEVMGRECPAIAISVSKKVNADYCVSTKNDLDYEKIGNIILDNFKENKSSCIVVRENIENIEKIVEKLNQFLGRECMKFQVVGRTQRGGTPTKEELAMADKFSKEVVSLIKQKVFGLRVLADEDMNIFVDEFENL